MRSKEELLETRFATSNQLSILMLEVLVDIRDVLAGKCKSNPEMSEGMELLRQSEAERNQLLEKTIAARVAGEAAVHNDNLEDTHETKD